ncbi:MAG: GAF domain-containing protein [Actinobacteria bacterium]|nr:GAF domain-containing protein [Actinomycetota bacterium]
MRIRFWGTRGSVPTPGPSTVRYGGNTSCTEVRTDDGSLIVIDCGTGARALGQALVTEAEASGVAPRGTILISHTHWDHIHGLPFFAPLFVEGSEWDIYGPRGLAQNLDRVLAGQMEYHYFPVALDEASADTRYHDLVEGTFNVPGAVIVSRYLNHPALTLGYRIEADGAVLVYASDHEPHDVALAGGEPIPDQSADGRHVAFLRGADVVVHDTQYELANYGSKQGWGHSTMEYVVEVASEADVGTLVMSHHDPNRDDAAVDDLLLRAQARARDGLEVVAAAEGTMIEVLARGHARAAAGDASATAEPALETLAPCVVVAIDDPVLDAAVRAAALAEGLTVERPDEHGADLSDAVVVVDADDSRFTGIGAGALSVLGATRRAVPTAIATTVSDWLVLPCSIAHVRTKLRAAVLRRAARWLAAPVGPDEQARLASLHRLAVLDTPPDPSFDRLAELARAATGTPIALVTLVDEGRQWFKAHLGFDATETHRDESFCAHAILTADVMQVPDVLEDGRFADNPISVGPGRIRFYAGAPLTLHDGNRVGTLCVADRRPRVLSDEQVTELKRLADLVVDELEARAGIETSS